MQRFLSILLLCLLPTSLLAEGDPRKLYRLGEERLRLEDDSLAWEYYRSIIEDYPLSSYAPDAQFRLGQLHYRGRRYEEADRQFREVAERFRTSRHLGELPFWRGLTAFALKDYQRAIDHLNDYLAAESPPLRGRALLYHGLSHRALGDRDEAIFSLEKLLRETSGRPSGYILSLLGNLYLELGRFRSLKALLGGQELRRIDSPWREQLLLLSAEVLYSEDKGAAGEVYRELIGTPGRIGAISYQRLFTLLLEEGNLSGMQVILDWAERDMGGEPELLKDFWLRIGIALYRADSDAEAKFYLRKVFNLSASDGAPDPLSALYLARMAQKRGQLTQARELLEDFRARGGRMDLELLFTLGELKTRQEDWEGAIDVWEEMRQNFPSSALDPHGSYYHGYCLYRLGRPESALEALAPLLQEEGGAAQRLQGEYRLGLMRLLAELYGQAGRYAEAASLWREYGRLAFRDPRTPRGLLRNLFLGGFHEEVIAEGLALKRDPAFMEGFPEVSLMAAYVSGLAALSLERYDSALEDLMTIGEGDLSVVGWDALFPYILYYRGWAHYRSARFRRALRDFQDLTEKIASSTEAVTDPLLLRGYYLAGWCAFQLRDYSQAAEFFLAYASTGEEPVKGRLMGARSLRGGGEKAGALGVLEELLSLDLEDPLVEDALFEKGEILEEMGDPGKAAAVFLSLHEGGGSLSEQALFRRGEVLFAAGLWRKAQEAFYLYRRQFSRGGYADAAHYWGGQASFNLGEPFGAVLLWERLITDFPDSSFRGGALWKSASVYEVRGDYERAFSLVKDLSRISPEEAAAFGAPAKEDELRYLIAGNSPEEASLRAMIGSFGGAEDPEGRETILELARILLFKGGDSREEAKLLLGEVLFFKGQDLPRAARAQFYLGEYYQRRGDLDAAGEAFLEAASMNPQDRDLMAMSIFRAAEIAGTQGKRLVVEALVKRLTENFPRSSWAEAGQNLLGRKKDG